MPMPRPPEPAPFVPYLDVPPPKLLPLFLLPVDLLFVTPVGALPLSLPPDAFRLPLLKLPRPRSTLRPPLPLLRPRDSVFCDCARASGIGGPA